MVYVIVGGSTAKHALAGEILAALAQPWSIFVLSLLGVNSVVGEDSCTASCICEFVASKRRRGARWALQEVLERNQ